ncbi:MAG: oxaloacetate decarboxylase subunit alpha, partial [Clostridia bacterium]|nr:oxaloacetate decarboxylase subunit alpha [Clostridia bacterium]
TCRPADLLSPEYDKLKEEMKEYYTQEEDVLSYALFSEVAVNFFKKRLAKKSKIDKDLAENHNGVYPV